MTSVYDLSFPVIAARPERHPPVAVDICGTAFSIGGQAYLTAGHVVSGLQKRADNTKAALGRFHEGSLDGWLCEGRGEIDEATDLGLLRCPNTDASRLAFRWRPSQVEDLGLLHDVWSAGYPFALNTETGYFYVRAFRGHIVGEGAFQDLRGNPGIYELSFHCPRGLSGAPLVSGRDDQQQLVGVVIGNKSTSMTVFRRTETEKEGATVRELIQDEVMHIGVAIKARSVFAVRFGSLGCTIGEWLSRHGLYGP